MDKSRPTDIPSANHKGKFTPYNSCQSSSFLVQLGTASDDKDRNKIGTKLKNLLKDWNIGDTHTFALVISNIIGAVPSVERVRSANDVTEISFYLDMPQYSLRIGLHNMNAKNYSGLRKRPKNYGITFKDATDADTFRPNKDVDVKEYVYVYWTKERLKKIAEAILHLLENGEWDNDIAPADYVNPQQSKGSKGLGGVNDYYVLYDDDWNEIADFGRGKNLRTVKKEAKQILESKNISEATLEIQDAWSGEIKDSITIDLGRQPQKREKSGGVNSLGFAQFRISNNKTEFEQNFAEAVESKGIVRENLPDVYFPILNLELSPKLTNAQVLERAQNLNLFGTKRIIVGDNLGDLYISKTTFNKSLSNKAIDKSYSRQHQITILLNLLPVINNSIDVEIHPDYVKKGDVRAVENGYNKDILIHRLFSAVRIGDEIFRVKSTIREYRDKAFTSRPYTFEITKIELVGKSGISHKGQFPPVILYDNSISAAIILKNMEKSYERGVFLLNEQTSLSGVKRTATQTANHSALLRKHNIDLKRFEPFVSTDDLYPALQGVYFDPQGYLVASNSHVLIAEPAQIPQELSGKTINPKSQNECEGRFPDWRKAIPRAAQKTSEVDAARILQLADIVDGFEEVLGYEVFLRLFPERILFKHSYVRTVLDYARKYHNGQCRSYPNDSCRTHLLQAGDTQLLLCPMVPGAGNEYPDEIYTEPSSDGKITFHVCKQTNYRKWTSDSDYYQFVSDNLTIDELFCIALAHLRDYQLIDSHLRSLEWTWGGYHDLAYFNRRFNCWSNLVDVIRPLAKQPTAKEVDKRRAAYRKSVGPGYDSLTAAESAFLYVCNDANCALLAPYIEQKPITVPRYGLMKPRFDLKMFTDCVAKDDRYGHRFDCVYISPQNFVRATNGRIFVDIAVPTREVLTTPELQEKGLLVHPRSGIIEKGDYGNFDGIIASQWDNPVDANIGWDDISKALQAGGRKGLIRIDGGICLWGKDCAAALKMCSMFDFFRYAKFSVSKNNMLLVISAGLSRIIIAAALPADADCSIVDPTTTDRQRRLRLAQAKASAAAAVLALLKVRRNV